MDLAIRFFIIKAKNFSKPKIKSRKKCKNSPQRKNIMKMSHNIICIM
jgi:hypothetical protein